MSFDLGGHQVSGLLSNLAVGSASGVIGAAVFLVILSLLRPRIRVSPIITAEPTGRSDRPFQYRIKVVNRSPRPCVDVSIRAWRVVEHTIPAKKEGKFGKRRVLKEIDLKRHNGGMIAGYRPFDDNASYAKQVRFAESAIGVLTEKTGAYLLVEVVARDGWSGFPKSCRREYRLNTQIEYDKTFAAGRSMTTKPWTEAKVQQAQEVTSSRALQSESARSDESAPS